MTVTSYTVVFGTRIPSNVYMAHMVAKIYKDILKMINEYFNKDISNIICEFKDEFMEYDGHDHYYEYLSIFNRNSNYIPIVNGLILAMFPHDIEEQIDNYTRFQSYFVIGLKAGEFGDGRKNFIRNDDSNKMKEELNEKLNGTIYEKMIEGPYQDPRYFTVPNNCDCCS